MKLLFDQNISYRLVDLISDIYSGSSHVRDHELQQADDETVWKFAHKHDFAIVSKDADFHQRSFLYGFPPKVIWIRKGNCSTKEIKKILRANLQIIEKFAADKNAAFLTLD